VACPFWRVWRDCHGDEGRRRLRRHVGRPARPFVIGCVRRGRRPLSAKMGNRMVNSDSWPPPATSAQRRHRPHYAARPRSRLCGNQQAVATWDTFRWPSPGTDVPAWALEPSGEIRLAEATCAHRNFGHGGQRRDNAWARILCKNAQESTTAVTLLGEQQIGALYALADHRSMVSRSDSMLWARRTTS
jgi:hypothetical protein